MISYLDKQKVKTALASFIAIFPIIASTSVLAQEQQEVRTYIAGDSCKPTPWMYTSAIWEESRSGTLRVSPGSSRAAIVCELPLGWDDFTVTVDLRRQYDALRNTSCMLSFAGRFDQYTYGQLKPVSTPHIDTSLVFEKPQTLDHREYYKSRLICYMNRFDKLYGYTVTNHN